MDARRLFVAGLVLEADADEVPGLQHLLGRLGVAGLVSVDRRQPERARQQRRQRQGEHENPRPGRGEERKHGRSVARLRGLSPMCHGFPRH
ncbi:MAG: hypothetical protein EXQ95_10580 [Alphaproteobacteria bacterium]|nr:hypothetical protein [Alphaproteobacteria bacterium]